MTPPPGLTLTAEQLAEAITLIVNDVAELGDRTSPEDWPEAMLVTMDELEAILKDRLTAETAPEEGLEWEPISTLPDCDDIMWFCRGDTFEGPRAAHGDEADYWDWWCYAKPPSLPSHKAKPPTPAVPQEPQQANSCPPRESGIGGEVASLSSAGPAPRIAPKDCINGTCQRTESCPYPRDGYCVRLQKYGTKEAALASYKTEPDCTLQDPVIEEIAKRHEHIEWLKTQYKTDKLPWPETHGDPCHNDRATLLDYIRRVNR